MEKNVDFQHMDIPSVEALVGRKALDVEVKNENVLVRFGGTNTALPGNHTGVGANISVSFRRW